MPGKNPSLRKPKGAISLRTRTRIEMAIRLEMKSLGMTDSAIAEHIGIKAASYARIKKLAIYRQLRSQFTTGLLSAADADIYNNYQTNKERINIAVPMAIEKLLAIATSNKDDKLALAASTEILDRHGMFAKVSRTGNALPDQGGAAGDEDNKVASELIKALADAKKA